MAERLAFPEGFVWGTATASFQIEGGRDERGTCIWDDFCDWTGKVFQGHNGDIADDHYHRYREDVALMKELGGAAYRFSISWPRVLPEGHGAVNPKGLDFYNRLVDELLENGITPYVTLYHWDLPSALQRMGGWAARDTASRFADYCEVMARALGDRVKDWITHNEPWVVAFIGNLQGRHAPGWEDLGLALQIGHHLLLSHGLAVPILRQHGDADTRVGITLNFSPAYPASDSAEDVAAARRHDGYTNRWFMDPLYKGSYPADLVEAWGAAMPQVSADDLAQIAVPIDFLGVNYYSRAVVKHQPGGLLDYATTKPEGEYTHMEWEVFPKALEDLLLRLSSDYAPQALYITENGCAYPDTLTAEGKVHDPKRIEYLRQHLAASQRAITLGAPLQGYFAWSLMDNFEWGYGYSRRFGLIYVDYETMQRHPKDSFYAYQSIIAENAVEL